MAIWLLNGTQCYRTQIGHRVAGWIIAATGDYDGDGKSDILWTDGSGDMAIWFMNGATIVSTAGLGNVRSSWSVQSANSE